MKSSIFLTTLSFAALTECSEEKTSPFSEFTTTTSITRSTPGRIEDSPYRPPTNLSREDLVATPHNFPPSPNVPTRSFTPEETAYRQVQNAHQELLLELKTERTAFLLQQEADFKNTTFSWFDKKRNKPKLLLKKQEEEFQAFLTKQREKLKDYQRFEQQFLHENLETLERKIKDIKHEEYKKIQLRKFEKHKNEKVDDIKKRHEDEICQLSPFKSRDQHLPPTAAATPQVKNLWEELNKK